MSAIIIKVPSRLTPLPKEDLHIQSGDRNDTIWQFHYLSDLKTRSRTSAPQLQKDTGRSTEHTPQRRKEQRQRLMINEGMRAI